MKHDAGMLAMKKQAPEDWIPVINAASSGRSEHERWCILCTIVQRHEGGNRVQATLGTSEALV